VQVHLVRRHTVQTNPEADAEADTAAAGVLVA
jgi:hypothetical protein